LHAHNTRARTHIHACLFLQTDENPSGSGSPKGRGLPEGGHSPGYLLCSPSPCSPPPAITSSFSLLTCDGAVAFLCQVLSLSFSVQQAPTDASEFLTKELRCAEQESGGLRAAKAVQFIRSEFWFKKLCAGQNGGSDRLAGAQTSSGDTGHSAVCALSCVFVIFKLTQMKLFRRYFVWGGKQCLAANVHAIFLYLSLCTLPPRKRFPRDSLLLGGIIHAASSGHLFCL
jgi:hypothetical protein